jgi:hypothetical protein
MLKRYRTSSAYPDLYEHPAGEFVRWAEHEARVRELEEACAKAATTFHEFYLGLTILKHPQFAEAAEIASEYYRALAPAPEATK